MDDILIGCTVTGVEFIACGSVKWRVGPKKAIPPPTPRHEKVLPFPNRFTIIFYDTIPGFFFKDSRGWATRLKAIPQRPGNGEKGADETGLRSHETADGRPYKGENSLCPNHGLSARFRPLWTGMKGLHD